MEGSKIFSHFGASICPAQTSIIRDGSKPSGSEVNTEMDKHAFAGQLQADRARYYRIAYSYVKNEQDALDIVSEAAYRGLRDLRSLRSPEFFRTWMTRIVVNCAIDFLRKDSRLVSLDDTAPEPVEVADTALQCEDTLDLYDALDVLTERDKTCVTLRFFEQYSFVEIARILGEPETTVKTRVYRALKKMRAYLEKGEK